VGQLSAADFGEGGEFLAFGLRDVEHVDTPEPVKPRLAVFLIGILGGGFFVSPALLADHGSQNEDAFFAAFDEAAKRVPRANSGDVGGLGLLACDEQDVAKALCDASKYVSRSEEEPCRARYSASCT